MVDRPPGNGRATQARPLKSPGPRKPPLAASKDPVVAAKWAKAVRLRLAGAKLAEIAAELGYADESGAKYAVEGAIRESFKASGAEALRAVDQERMETLHPSRWKRALDGDDDAADYLLRLMARRAKLLGLDAPVKLQHSGDPENPVVVMTLNNVDVDALD